MKKLLLITILLLVSTYVSAMEVSLSWDVNPDADYYVVYWGEESLNYTNNSENITGAQYTAENVSDKQNFFAVKAFNECGNSSGFSDEVSSMPVPSAVSSVLINSCSATIVTTTTTTITQGD